MADMDLIHLTDDLNDKQRQAVEAPPGNYLVLAGAGSGKTSVLVRRIVYLMRYYHVSPYAILAVTFTNKAAHSMRARIQHFLHHQADGMWVGTFHSLCHRLLRSHYREANLEEHFQILDTDDQLRLIKRVLKELHVDEDYFSPKKVQHFINAKKDQGLRASQVPNAQDFYTQTMVKIYQAYDDACFKGSLVDFAELMLRTFELLKNNQTILEHYQRRFQYLLIDEFQDTNAIQYAWIKLLAGKNSHVMIVGDDDQSIYGWRGAKVENIHRFQRDFANAQLIRLEQNYRSTHTILSAANAVISNNQERLGKNLWTEGEQGDAISLYSAFNEIDEARFVADRIHYWVNHGGRYDEIAILYRSNAQSRVLEEALIQGNIPYRIYGGVRFFERAEIKDALSYLRLIIAPNDDTAFERIVNVPTRGIGERTVATIRDYAKQHEISLLLAAKYLVQEKAISSKTELFLQLIEKLANEIENMPLHDQVEYVIQHSGLLEHYGKERGEKAQSRIENLAELVSAARQFLQDAEIEGSALALFLAGVALESGDDKQDANQNSVQLMTLHSAKGLEFPMVFITGVEEGLFPHPMSCEEPTGLEEERRLLYVGITRAQKKLCLSFAEVRRLHGSEQYHRRSRFIEEIPVDLLDEVRMKSVISRPVITEFFDEDRMDSRLRGNDKMLGQRVRHRKFGEGVIINHEGSGASARVQVKFQEAGTKWLVEAYANLEKI